MNKSKKVCIVSNMHPFYDLRVVEKEAKSLAKRYDTYLIMANEKDRDYDGIHVVGVDLPTARLRRMFTLKPVLKKMIEVDADVYHFEDPELLPLRSALQKRGKKVIFDSHEYFADLILTKLWIPAPLRKPLSWLYKRYEKRNYPKFDALISVTPFIIEKFKPLNPNTYQVTNYPILVPFVDNRQWGKSVSFAGAIMWEWMHDKIINSLSKTNARYLLAGSSNPYCEELQKLENWNRVDYVGRLTSDKVYAFLQQSSAALHISSYKDPNTGYKKGTLGVNKMFEYMNAGMPIICSAHEIWKEIIDKYECGICVDPESETEIAEAINTLVNDQSLAKRMGDNARRAAEVEFNWGEQEKILYELYDKLLKQ